VSSVEDPATLTITTCPTDVFAAPADRVWRLVTDPVSLARWSGCELLRGPTHGGSVREGDRLVLGVGLGAVFRVEMRIIEAIPPARLSVDVSLPFGVVNHEVIVVASVTPQSCRVTFN
jgi:uncharacterized protein YndB with AHSA1/START domain